MSTFEGFRAGCPARYEHGRRPYVSHIAYFMAGGDQLTAEEAGLLEPDLVRVVPIGDYWSTAYNNRDYVLDSEIAALQVVREDDVSASDVVQLDPTQLADLNELCTSCQDKGTCPVLEAIVSQYFESLKSQKT